VTTDIETFYKNALQFTISRSMLTQLEEFFDQGVAKEDLEYNHEKKRWEMNSDDSLMLESPTKIPDEVLSFPDNAGFRDRNSPVS
jgi:hypothetical protein